MLIVSIERGCTNYEKCLFGVVNSFVTFTKILYDVIAVGWVNVEWDTGLSLSYRYGSDGLITAYDIEPSDEPRILEHEAIAVGCLVRRGIASLVFKCNLNEMCCYVAYEYCWCKVK